MDNEQFQSTVLNGVETLQTDVKKSLAEQATQIDNLSKETKKALEDLTAVKNHANDVDESMKSIKRLHIELENEKRRAIQEPLRRLVASNDNREALNYAFRHATSVINTPVQKAGPVLNGATPGSTYIIGDLANEIYDVLSTYGVWSSFQTVQLTTKTTTFPVATDRPVASFITSEAGQISEDGTKQGTSVNLTPVPIAVLLYASLDALQDSEFDISSMLMNDFAQAYAYRMDWACLAADGTADATDGGMTGIFSGGTAATAANGNTTVKDLEYEDVLACLENAPAAVRRRAARWWIHPTILAKFSRIKDGNGRSLFQTALETPTPMGVGSILGYPVVLADAAPSTDSAGKVVAVFGDPAGLVVGTRMGWEFMSSDEYKFDYLRRYFRGVGRGGCIIRAATAFQMLTTASA